MPVDPRNALRIIWQNAQSAHRAAKRSLPEIPHGWGARRSPASLTVRCLTVREGRSLVLIRLHGAGASDPRTAFGAGFSARGDVITEARAAGMGSSSMPCGCGWERNLYGLAAVGRSVARCAPAARTGGKSEMLFPHCEIEVSPFVPPLVASSPFPSSRRWAGFGRVPAVAFSDDLRATPIPRSARRTSSTTCSPVRGRRVPGYYREKTDALASVMDRHGRAVPEVVIGGLVRINWLADVRPFKLFVALVLLGIGLEMIRDLFGWMRFKPAPKYEQSPPKPYVEVVGGTCPHVSYTFDGYLCSFSVPILLFYSIAVGLVGGIYGIGGGGDHRAVPRFPSSICPSTRWRGRRWRRHFVNALAGVLFYIAISPLYPDLGIAPDWGHGPASQPRRVARHVFRREIPEVHLARASQVDARCDPFWDRHLRILWNL